MIHLINTGGTFNKIYNQKIGKLEVPKDNKSIEKILQMTHISNVHTDGIIYKDSLEITSQDRQLLVNNIKNKSGDKIIIIHGTDTINQTADFLSKHIYNKTIILVGSMVPFSIDPIEASANLMLACGYLQNCNTKDIMICMSGMIKHHTNICKDKTKGIFYESC